MGKWREQKKKCKACGNIVDRSEMRLRPNGAIKENKCRECRHKSVVLLTRATHIYRHLLKKEKCIICGFTGEPCQMDIDHIDGNHRNNKKDNLRVVCANCHRIISKKQQIQRYSKNMV